MSRADVILELVQSEQQYNRFMQVLSVVYEEPLRNKHEFLSREDWSFIFSNFQPIRKVHVGLQRDLERLLEQIESATEIQKNLGQIFLEHTPSFKVYAQYCNQFTLIKSLLNDLRTKNDSFTKWLKRTLKQNVQITAGNGLDSLMIMPIQRLAKYKLLLSEILKKTTTDQTDYDDLYNAVELVKYTNEYVNMQIREYNNAIKMESLAKAMSATGCPSEIFDLLSPNRRLLHEESDVGLESIKNDSCMFNLNMFLFNDVILFMKKVIIYVEEERSNGYSFASLISMGEEAEKKEIEELHYENRIHLDAEPAPWIKDVCDEKSFQIITRRDVFIVYAPNEETKMSWMKRIIECLDAILQEKSTPPKRAKVLTKYQLRPPPIILKSPRTARSPHSPSHKKSASLLDFFTYRKQVDEVSYLTHALIDRTLFPTRNFLDDLLQIRSEEELASLKSKRISEHDIVVKAMSTFIDDTHEALPDEIQFSKGDLMLVCEKINEDFWICQKLGVNCEPDKKQQLIDESVPSEYEQLKIFSEDIFPNHYVQIKEEIFKQEKTRQISFDMSIVNKLPSDERTLARPSSFSSFFTLRLPTEEETLLANLINLPSEFGQIGIVPAKFFIEIQPTSVLKLSKLLAFTNR
jgi:hypothetical protein